MIHLEKREAENITAFTVRLMRAEFLEEAARIVESEAVFPDETEPDPTDISYNMALEHAATAIRRAAAS